MPGGKPTIALPGETPTLPEITLGPVLVTVLPASTPKSSTVGPRNCASALVAAMPSRVLRRKLPQTACALFAALGGRPFSQPYETRIFFCAWPRGATSRIR